MFIHLSTSVAFEREPEEPGAMRRPPRSRAQPLLDRGILAGLTLAGGFSARGHLPSAETLTTRTFVALVYEAAGHPAAEGPTIAEATNGPVSRRPQTRTDFGVTICLSASFGVRR